MSIQNHKDSSISKSNVVAFAQNTREEVRILGDDGNVAGCVSAESGTHQTTYVMVTTPKSKNNENKKKRMAPIMLDVKWWTDCTDISSTVTATWYKDPPLVLNVK